MVTKIMVKRSELKEGRLLMRSRILINIFLFVVIMLGVVETGLAEINLIDTKDYVFSITPYFRTEVVALKNNIDLDSKNSDDTTAYLGFDYSFGFGFKSKESGPELYLKLERNGPYDYDAPLFVHNTLRTSTANIDRYSADNLLPQIEEFWIDIPVYSLPLRLKSGLYAYEVGNGISLGGAYENYGLSLAYTANEKLKFGFYYCRPDWVHKSYLGERPKEDKQQGINYQHTKANFFALDSNIVLNSHAIQPYVGVLIDNTNIKRTSNFSTPTHKDVLGTFGTSWTGNLNNLSFNLEVARNFGKAKSSDEAYKDVEHTGYAFYADTSYAVSKLTPHFRFFYASGNKVTTDMVNDTALTSGKNRAFSVYSPFNTNIGDSLYPSFANISLPLVAAGDGYGLNYGIARPSTFGDPRLPDNIILYGSGFDWALTKKISLGLNWWYLRAAERGIGTYDGISKKLSADLGHEVDFSCTYTINDNVSLGLLSGYFFPGKYYKQERDDTGVLFTPFVRGDGEANGAYQIELSLEFSF